MPLSEYEQRVLDQLEAQLASEDPELGSRLAAAASPRRSRVALGLVAVAAGLAVLVLGVGVSLLWVSLAGFLLMFAGGLFALSTPKARGLAGPGAGAKPAKPGLSDRFQKRIDGREDGV